MKNQSKFTRLLVVLCLILAIPVLAANVSMTASDPGGSSSLISAGKWGNLAAPSVANDYFTSTFFLRTPADSGGITYTFAGNSLTLQEPSGQGAPMRSIIYKGGASDTIIINNLTNAAGGVLNNGGSGNVAAPTFTGSLWTIAGNSTILSDQGSTIIGYPLAGSAILTNSSGQGRTITYTGNLSGFTGKFFILNSATVALNSGSSNLGNPGVTTRDQITIGNGCALLDNVGLTFNNANGGITLLGPGNAAINAASITIISEPITDLTNGVSSVSRLTTSGGGILTLSNAANNYSGGTTISAGTLRIGIANALPVGTLTNNGTLDINTINTTIDGLSGAGTVDTQAGGTPTLTVGANGSSGTFSGTILNSSGTLSMTKVGAGTETLSGGYTYSGATVVAGGTLSLTTAASVPSSPGDLVVSNSAILAVDVSPGVSLPVNNLVFGLGNATNNFNYGTLAANPTAPAINAVGGISAPASTVVINIAATGLQPGTITLIKYTGTPLASIANFQLSPPPGVAATLVNNTGNDSIDLNITSIPNQLAWNGVNGGSWDLATANWRNLAGGGITVFQQYTNGTVIAGDAVTFDDSVTNDFVNPQPTNIVLNSTFSAFPVVVNTSLPYSIAGAGGIAGVTSLASSGSGSLTLLTKNSFTGGVNLTGGSLIITNDSALGASSGTVTLNGGTLQINGNTTNNVRPFSMPVASTIGVSAGAAARLGGVISGVGSLSKVDNGTLILSARETFTGNLFGKGGTLVLDSGGSINNGGNYSSIGQNGADIATMTVQGTGTFTNTGDFNIGDLDSSAGTLNIQGTAVLSIQNLYIASANAAGSTASGTINMTAGTLIQKNPAAGTFSIGGRNSGNAGNGVGVINLTGGYISAAAGIRVGDYGMGTISQSGGILEVTNNGTGINLRRQSTGVSGAYNLNGGTLRTEKVTSSQATGTREFYFNGGTLQAGSGNLGATPFMNSLSHAYVRNGGAVIDSQGYSILISQALEHSAVGGDNAVDGGITKLGSGTVTLSGVNTFTGSLTNKAGTLFLNSASTYAGDLRVTAGTLQVTTASVIQGGTTVSNNAVLSIVQLGSATSTVSNLTFNGAATGVGATLGLTPATANNPNLALVNCGTLTLNGTNTISLAAVNVGTLALIKYVSTAGSGNITNLNLPQGATGYVSNSAANLTLYAVITSTGPGLVWTGTNSVSPNLWDIGSTTNWLVNLTATSYHQIITPGDSVIFTDIGSGTVILNTNVAPAGMIISNNSIAYTFSGSSGISGATGLKKLGSGTAILNLTNNSYTGNTVISNGILQVANNGTASGLSSAASLNIGPNGTLNLSSQQANATTTVGEFVGAGTVHYTGGNNSTLAFGGSSGGNWNGTIYDNGGGGLSLIKSGAGTWVVGGTNYLNNGDFFNAISQNQFNGGTTVITNAGLLSAAFTEVWIAQGAGSTGSVVVAGGTLAVSNNWLCVGRGDVTANGTLIVNNGIVRHAGNNNIVVGSSGAAGTLIVNGGQVLNNHDLWLGENATGSGTLYLNGGLVQAGVLRPNGATPVMSIAYFNGGTLQAITNNASFLQVVSMVMSNGLVLDDNGYTLSIGGAALQAGDANNGGLIKKGSGAVYLDAGNTYTGITLVTNGLLAGVGSIAGPVVVAPAGNIGAGDAGASVGSPLTINNSLTLQGIATFRISKNGGVPANDQVIGLTTANYGGTLIVSNVTSDATPLTAGDTFQLFSVSGSESGNFSNIVGSPGGGLSYSFSPASGLLSVVASLASNPTNMTFTVSGNTLTLSWPADHLGWILQSQTNGLSTGLGTNWVDVPGSASVTSTNLTMNPQTPAGFYRLRKP